MSVSVLIPAFNVANVIERALNSAIAQTQPPLEILVIDDASQDRTREVVEAFGRTHPSVRLIRMAANGGPSRARNAGLAEARGDWVAMLDADDAWKPERLAALTGIGMAEAADFVADNQIFWDADAQREGPIAFDERWDTRVVTPEILFENDVVELSPFPYSNFKPVLSRRFLHSNGLRYNEEDRYGEDFRFFADVVFHGGKAVVTSRPLYIYTTRIGAFSKKVSPHTRSVARFDLLVGVCDALERQYGATASPRLRQAMTMRKTRIKAIALANQARAQRQSRRYIAYAATVIRNPELLALLLGRTVKRSVSQVRKLVPRG